ncbi:MAG: hypothetical protein JRF29_05460 [Deltaproteobacteria bacterium]|nr:hypothetical protein [Deltaproteobacteria bacterium]
MTGVRAQREKTGTRIFWNAAADCNANAVAGYNVYRAATAAGPFSKINTALITHTAYFDTDSGVGIASGGGSSGDSGYYMVTAVDSGGTESVHSLAIKPASMASGTSDGSGGGGGGCFITTVQDTLPVKSGWAVVILMVVLIIAKGVWCRVSAKKRTEG